MRSSTFGEPLLRLRRRLALPLLATAAIGWPNAAAANGNTPTTLADVPVVDAKTVAAMHARGEAHIIDTRALHDYLAGHLPGAYHADYRERSARTPAFDRREDDTAAFLRRLRKFAEPGQAVVFYCNGPACWKSYKAAAVARDAGYRRLHWFRGGLSEWRQQGNPVVVE